MTLIMFRAVEYGDIECYRKVELITNVSVLVGARFASTDVRDRAEARRDQPAPRPSTGRGRAAVTMRIEAGSPIRVHPRAAGRGREIISVDPGQVAREAGVEIHLGAATHKFHIHQCQAQIEI